MTRQEMVKKILRQGPCVGVETVRKWSKFWPKNVTLHWLLTHNKRGKETVPLDNQEWLALVLLPQKANDRALDKYYRIPPYDVGHNVGHDFLLKCYIAEAKKLLPKKKPKMNATMRSATKASKGRRKPKSRKVAR